MTVKTLQWILKDHNPESEVVILTQNSPDNFDGWVKVGCVLASVGGPHINLSGCIIEADEQIEKSEIF